MKSHYFVQSFAGVSMPEPFLKASDLFVGITYGGVVELYLQTQLQLNSKPNRTGFRNKIGFHVAVNQRTTRKSTNFQTARAEPLFYPVYLLLEHALVSARS